MGVHIIEGHGDHIEEEHEEKEEEESHEILPISSKVKHSSSSTFVFLGRASQITMLFVGFSVLAVFLLNSASPIRFPAISQLMTVVTLRNETKLERVLREASMENKTVILATLNDAWIEPGSIFDLFLESFRIGNNTQKLINHLVIVTWDQKAYNRCLEIHPHCYQMKTKGEGDFGHEAFYMSKNYLHMMWRRTEFLGSVLQTGYSFVFTDLDIMWLRDPFPQFYKDVDFQIACDFFNGNPSDTNNMPNGGFKYVQSNPRTIEFYKLWFNSSKVYPNLNEQEVLNKIKTHPFVSQSNFTIRFLDTDYFGGFCAISKDFNKVCTMHANCCFGLNNKISDLRALLEDWKKYMDLNSDQKQQDHPTWSVPRDCKISFERALNKGNKKHNL